MVKKTLSSIFNNSKIDLNFCLQKLSLFPIKLGYLQFAKNTRSSSIWKQWGCLPYKKIIEVIFHIQKNWGHPPFIKQFEFAFHLPKKYEVLFHLKNVWSSSIYKKKWGCLPFMKTKLRSSYTWACMLWSQPNITILIDG